MDISELKVFQFTGKVAISIWPEVTPLVDLGLAQGCGEKTSSDLLQGVIDEQLQLFVARDKDKVHAVMVTAILQYPQYKTIFIETMAGRGLVKVIKEYWPIFTLWAKDNGAIAIEGTTRPSVTRLLRKVNMQKVYDVVRVSLETPTILN